MKTYITCLSLLFVLSYSQAQNRFNQYEPYFSTDFECFLDSNGLYGISTAAKDYTASTANDNYWCCGITANGERSCAPILEWTMPVTGKFALCSRNLNNNDLKDGNVYGKRDLCCDNSYFNDCNHCTSFVVWEFDTQTDMEDSPKVTLNTTWRDAFDSQDMPSYDSYFNKVYPAGYIHARLREGNDPPVCVYIPGGNGHVIEIQVEPDEEGNRLCVGDLHDDRFDKNNPGQTTTCDDSQLRSCFSDGSVDDQIPGLAFYIQCDSSCEEQTDIYLWVRARKSSDTWINNGNNGAANNIEMWCDTVNGEYPLYDVYPSQLAPPADPIDQSVTDSASSLVLVFMMFVFLFY
jgi:hypothetical protein